MVAAGGSHPAIVVPATPDRPYQNRTKYSQTYRYFRRLASIRVRAAVMPASRVRGSVPAHERHLRPSRRSRMSTRNGLLLTPTIDHLFDRGFISFEDSGILIVSPVQTYARNGKRRRPCSLVEPKGNSNRPNHQCGTIH
jgi:hypothetical protein